jgi:tetratricopeptide (TPR) repeat protein
VFTRLAIIFSLAASIWGQTLSLAPLLNLPRAEDSAETEAGNRIFYNNPRGLEPEHAPEPAGTVSVEQLRHPVSRKGDRLLRQAQNFAAMGNHHKAIAQLQAALKERSAIPYAHSMLGIEYLKTNQVPAAVAELEQAVTLLPRNVADHSNLAYALLLSGDLDRGEKEVREALELDRNNSKTRMVLSWILRARQTRAQTKP